MAVKRRLLKKQYTKLTKAFNNSLTRGVHASVIKSIPIKYRREMNLDTLIRRGKVKGDEYFFAHEEHAEYFDYLMKLDPTKDKPKTLREFLNEKTIAEESSTEAVQEKAVETNG